jgi:hypothetical protein
MGYEIPITECRPGDTILCDEAGPVAGVLSFLIGLFNNDWRTLKRKPWHCRLVVSGYGATATVLEALAPGVVNSPIDSIPLDKQHAYRWLDSPINSYNLTRWAFEHLGKRYDVLAYFWTAFQYLFRAIWNRYIPRLLDDHYTCWELVMEFYEDFGKPMHSKRDCPLITDLCYALHIMTPTLDYTNKKLSVVAERSK